MDPLLGLLLFAVGLTAVIYSAEKLVKGVVGVSAGFGVSAFLISVIFIGFDPENLFVGAAGTFEGLSGIALGSVLGASMVAIALAFGITALFTELKFKKVSKEILAVAVGSVVTLYLLSVDGDISRFDGGVLLLGFIGTIYYLVKASKEEVDIKPEGEVKETLEVSKKLSKWKAVLIFVFSLVGLIAGSELLVNGAKPIISFLGLTDTVFGMTILALLVSVEELARELPAALKGRPDISFGNVVGSIIAFFLFNAGIIALISPVKVTDETLYFHFPVVLITVIVIAIFMLRKKIPRWAGGILVGLYIIFFAGSYFM